MNEKDVEKINGWLENKLEEEEKLTILIASRLTPEQIVKWVKELRKENKDVVDMYNDLIDDHNRRLKKKKLEETDNEQNTN